MGQNTSRTRSDCSADRCGRSSPCLWLLVGLAVLGGVLWPQPTAAG